MSEANYGARNGSAWSGEAGHFDVNGLTYDKNGNIKTLNRYTNVNGARTKMDGLTYGYANSNRLQNVEDNGNTDGFKNGVVGVTTEYGYDDNGNLTFDLNKGITDVKYNYLNLPEEVTMTGNKKIQFTYDATGNRLKKKVLENGNVSSETDYAGIMQYEDEQLSFFWTSEGKALKQLSVHTPIIKEGSGFEYEYFITDHQGNTRLTFGKMEETDVYKATMETERDYYESTLLGFINLNTRHTDLIYNITPDEESGGVANESARLNGFDNTAIGPGRAISVKEGDKVTIHTFAKYSQSTGGSAAVISNIVSLVTSAFGVPTSTDAQSLYQAFNNNLPGLASSITTGNSQVPKAYLNYIIFDENNVFSQFGYKAISTAALNAFEEISLEIDVPSTGTMYIYVANESNVNSNVNVFFDDLEIKHKKTNMEFVVKSSSDYYPFGAQIGSLSYQNYNTHNNTYGYQGVYAELDEETGWHAFELRQYDSYLGRWTGADPYAQFNSPYVGMGNVPHMGVDPDGGLFGMGAIASGAVIGATVATAVGAIVDDNFSSNWYKWTLGGAATGAGVGFAYEQATYDLTGIGRVWRNSGKPIGGKLKKGGSFKLPSVNIPSGVGDAVNLVSSIDPQAGLVGSSSRFPEIDRVAQNGGNGAYQLQWIPTWEGQNNIISSTAEAKNFYENGDGSPRLIDQNSSMMAVNSPEFQRVINRLVTGKANKISASFDVDMTSKVFHIGNTNVDYKTTIFGSNAYTVFKLFVRDGFWDANFIAEKFSGLNSNWVPDGMGPNLETKGSRPYQYVPVVLVMKFVNPGYGK